MCERERERERERESMRKGCCPRQPAPTANAGDTLANAYSFLYSLKGLIQGRVKVHEFCWKNTTK